MTQGTVSLIVCTLPIWGGGRQALCFPTVLWPATCWCVVYRLDFQEQAREQVAKYAQECGVHYCDLRPLAKQVTLGWQMDTFTRCPHHLTSWVSGQLWFQHVLVCFALMWQIFEVRWRYCQQLPSDSQICRAHGETQGARLRECISTASIDSLLWGRRESEKQFWFAFFFWRLPLPESACSWCKPVSGYWNLSQLPGRETPKCLECSERIQAFPQRVPCGEAFSVVRVLSQSLDTSTGMMVVWTCNIMKRSISDISEGRKDFRNQKLSSLAPVQLHTVMGSSGEALCDVTIPKLQNHPGQTQQYYQHLGGAEIKTPNLVSLQLWREICCCKMCTYSIWVFENRRF